MPDVKEKKGKKLDMPDQSMPNESLLAEVRELRQSVKNLKQVLATNDSLRNKVTALNEEIKTLKGEHKEMSSSYNRMRNILMLGNCSTLSLLIDEYVGITTPMVRQIVLEAHLIEFDAEERQKLTEVISYINDSSIALQQMLESPTLSIEDSSSKKQLKKLILDTSKSVKLVSARLDEFDLTQIKLLSSQFQEFLNFVNSFVVRG